MIGPLCDPLLQGVAHAFGTRGAGSPPDVLRPTQVHGSDVVVATPVSSEPLPAAAPDLPALGEADAIVSAHPGLSVGIVTADCVPVLAAAGDAVVAIHAGWRGLAAGVVEAGIAALRERAGGVEPRAAVGPHIGACCYEVDGLVWDTLGGRYGAIVDTALTPTRPGHARIALGAIVRCALEASGVDRIGATHAVCTSCDELRFESFRRDGSAAGRLLHWIRAPG